MARDRAPATPVLGAALYLVLLPFLAPQPAALCLVALAALFGVAGTPQMAASWRFLLPVLPFLASNLLAVLRADTPAIAAGFFSFMAPGLILFAIVAQDRRAGARRWMLVFSAFALVMALSVVLGWLRLRAGSALLPGEDVPQAALRLSGNQLLTVPNDLCVTAILAAFPLGILRQGAGGAARARPGQVLALVTLLAVLLALAVLRSRTGLLIAGGEILLAGLARPRLLAWIAPLCLVGVAADIGLGWHSLDKLAFAGAQDFHGVAGRFGLWVAAWRMFLTAPLLGHGAQSFGPGHWAMLPGWAPRFPEGHVLWAHNLYLDLLAEQGLVGAVCFALMFLPALRHALVAARQGADTARRELGWTALMAFAGFFLAAGLELSLIRRTVPLTLFALLGFAVRLGAPTPADAAPPPPIPPGGTP